MLPLIGHRALRKSAACQLVYLRAGEQIGSYSVDIARRLREVAGGSADRLNAAETPVSIYVREKTSPGPFDNWKVLLSIEEALSDPESERVGDESGAGIFWQPVSVGVEQPRTPQAVGTLQRRNCRCHLLQLLHILGLAWIVLRHLFQHSDQTSHHPAIAA